jgi:hypothetical protein
MPPRRGWRIFLNADATNIPLLRSLRQAPDAAFDVLQQTEVTQHLKLLADIIFHVPIIRVELFEFALESIDIGGGEGVGRDIALRCPDAAARRPYLVESPHGVQHVQRPTALRDGNVLQRFDALEFLPHLLRRNDDGSSRRESALTLPACP